MPVPIRLLLSQVGFEPTTVKSLEVTLTCTIRRILKRIGEIIVQGVDALPLSYSPIQEMGWWDSNPRPSRYGRSNPELHHPILFSIQECHVAHCP